MITFKGILAQRWRSLATFVLLYLILVIALSSIYLQWSIVRKLPYGMQEQMLQSKITYGERTVARLDFETFNQRSITLQSRLHQLLTDTNSYAYATATWGVHQYQSRFEQAPVLLVHDPIFRLKDDVIMGTYFDNFSYQNPPDIIPVLVIDGSAYADGFKQGYRQINAMGKQCHIIGVVKSAPSLLQASIRVTEPQIIVPFNCTDAVLDALYIEQNQAISTNHIAAIAEEFQDAFQITTSVIKEPSFTLHDIINAKMRKLLFVLLVQVSVSVLFSWFILANYETVSLKSSIRPLYICGGSMRRIILNSAIIYFALLVGLLSIGTVVAFLILYVISVAFPVRIVALVFGCVVMVNLFVVILSEMLMIKYAVRQFWTNRRKII